VVENQDGESLFKVLSGCNELEIFETDLIIDLIDYKWRTFAFRSHLYALLVHLSYMLVLIYYIDFTYVEHRKWNPETEQMEVTIHADPSYNYYQAICLVYPLFLEFYRLKTTGLKYFSSMNNMLDLMHIFFGFLNIYYQINVGPDSLDSQLIIIFECYLSLAKTFQFMKMVLAFSSVVTMIINVFLSLNNFIIYFFI
jgi:hypothetical protein